MGDSSGLGAGGRGADEPAGGDEGIAPVGSALHGHGCPHRQGFYRLPRRFAARYFLPASGVFSGAVVAPVCRDGFLVTGRAAWLPGQACGMASARWIIVCLVACVALPAVARSQTASLPPPAPSSLDRLAQAPTLSPPPPTWDPYAPQATQLVPPTAPGTSSWAPSAISGQPG